MSEDAPDSLSYLTSNTMATISSTLALAANVTAFDYTELWTLDSNGTYYCPCASMRKLRRKVPLEATAERPWAGYKDVTFPVLTEIAYYIENTNDVSIFIVGLATEKLQFKPSTFKFLQGLGYAIYVSSFLMKDNEGHDDAIT
eukprot:gene11037-12869_t